MPPKTTRHLATEEDVRRLLAGKIGREVLDDIWELLVDDNYVQEVLDGHGDAFNVLVERYRRYWGLKARSPQTKTTAKPVKECEIPPDRRHLALAEIAAIEASRMPEVVAFREEALAGQLMPLEEVPAWVEAKAKEEGEATSWVRVPLPPGVDVNFSRGHTLDWIKSLEEVAADKATWYPVGEEFEMLLYPPPPAEEQASRAIPIRRGGILYRLKFIAKRLTKTFTWWQEAQAVAFVLSGPIPLPAKGRGRIVWHSSSPSRIQLDLDPRLSSQEVASLYAKVRKHVFAGRDKPMSDKHLALAVFLAKHPDGTWKQIMKAWNEEKEKWIYSEWRSFARDASAAWERVTGRKWSKSSGQALCAECVPTPPS
ncbi:MAG: hypothetical protein AB1445_08780 [Bacillota bacterium]